MYFILIMNDCYYYRIFYWALTPSSQSESGTSPLVISEHQLEFLESWLLLIEKFSNPKTILDNQHLMQTKSLMLSKSPEFDANAFLAHMHKVWCSLKKKHCIKVVLHLSYI